MVFQHRSSKALPLRYYLYISDSKLDMLFEQIDLKSRKRISAELKIDLKVASLTLRGAENPGPTRTAKLQLVEQFIETHQHVGTIQEPGKGYFRGQMRMTWDWAGWNHDGVWFQGNDYDPGHLPQCIGLGGSRYHVLGEARPTGAPSGTGWPAIREILEERGFQNDPALVKSVFDGDLPEQWFNGLYWGPEYDRWTHLHGKLLSLEFLAIPLAETQVRVTGHGVLERLVHVVIGTPLYVAKV